VNTDVILLIKSPSGSSFPSTHSGFAAAVTTVLFARNRVFGFIAAVMTFCIAFSRLYLYVHYPTDVFAGLILGVLCALMVLRFSKQIGLRRKALR
jgi:undecaprenyl-diphosphatase